MTHKKRPPAELHRLIAAALKDPHLVVRLKADPRGVYESFSVPLAEQNLLLEDPRNALGQIGVHPNLQFKLLGILGLLELPKTTVEPYIASIRKAYGQNS